MHGHWFNAIKLFFDKFDRFHLVALLNPKKINAWNPILSNAKCSTGLTLRVSSNYPSEQIRNLNNVNLSDGFCPKSSQLYTVSASLLAPFNLIMVPAPLPPSDVSPYIIG
jgi:hypothetical protein